MAAITVDQCPRAGNCQQDRLLVFVHIPKTGGTTVVSALAHKFPADAMHKIMMRGMSWTAPGHALWPNFLISRSKIRRLKSALKDPHALRVIHGHFDLSLRSVLPADASLVTLLRDPVERVISHYCHYLRLTTDPAHELAARSSVTDWVSRSGLVEMDNGQTRRLAGAMKVPIGGVSSRTLDKAKANLAQEFSVVGLTERFEEFQILLHREFDWTYCRYPARNVGANRLRQSQLDAGALEIIRDRNRFDLELYRFASGLFERAAGKFDLDRELSLLRRAPALGEPSRTESPRSRPPIARPAAIQH